MQSMNSRNPHRDDLRGHHGAGFRVRNLAGVLVALALTACPDTKDKTEEQSDTEPDQTTDPCQRRAELSPPAYNWAYLSTSIGSTTLLYTCGTTSCASAIGLVVLFDGGAGNEAFWSRRIEPIYQAEALVAAGYALMALESEDPNSGNFDATDSEANPDIVNLRAAIDFAEAQGVNTSQLYYLGFSSGGWFASLATRFVPARALALFNVRGDPATFATFDPTMNLPPPTLWVIGANDPDVPPEDLELSENQSMIDSLGVDSETHLNLPVGLGAGAFTRIANRSRSVSTGDSEDARNDLRVARTLQGEPFLDACDVPLFRAAELDPSAMTPGPSFTREFIDEAMRQLDEMHAGHEFTSDFKSNVVSFFVAHP